MNPNKLLKLLVITWIADGKTEQQIQAFSRAAGLDDDELTQVCAEFKARLPKIADIGKLRAEAGASLFGARRALCSAANDLPLATSLAKNEGARVKKIMWFARSPHILRMGPFFTQVIAAKAVIGTNGHPVDGAFVWPEEVETKAAPTPRAASRKRARPHG